MRGNRDPISLAHSTLSSSLAKFTKKYITDHGELTGDRQLERIWYFEPPITNSPSNIKGFIHYGIYGFESTFVDGSTGEVNYNRKTTDIEEIPLYYEFWFPSGSNHAFVAFQSFQGRSCIALVVSPMREKFESLNPGVILRVMKVMMNDESSPYFDAPVRKLRLIKKGISGDIADRYIGIPTTEEVNIEISIAARRKRNLGIFGHISQTFRDAPAGVLLHDGIEFDEAVADVRIGGRTRPVGVFGPNVDAGVIELTDVVDKGPDGHPTYDSISKEVGLILRDFHMSMIGMKS
jgi:hypothetical protein